MTPDNANEDRNAALRRRAEERLRTTREQVASMPVEKVQDLVHELQVHQIELEMSNDELRRAQEDLAASRHRYATLFEQLPVGYLALDENLTIKQANSTAASLLGVSARRLSGDRLSRFALPHLRDRCYTFLQGAAYGAGPVTTEMQFNRAHGEVLIARLNVFRTAGPGGEKEEVLVTLADVGEQHRIVEDLKASERRYRFLYEQSQQANIVISIDGIIQDINSAPLRRLGYIKEEVIGRPLTEFVPEAQVETVLQLLREAVAGSEGREIDIQVCAKDGTWRTLMTSPGSEVLYESGRPAALLCSATDVTERRKEEEDLRYHARILECMAEAAVSTDLQYTIRSWNPAAERMYGWRAEEAVGTSAMTLLRTEYDEGSSREDVIRGLKERGFWEGEVVQYRRDGSPLHVAASLRTLKDGSGEAAGIVAVNRDITRRKQAEEALRQSREDLKRAQEVAHVGSWRAESDTEALACSEEACRIFGVPEESSLSVQQFFSLIHPDDRELVKRMRHADMRGESCDFDHRIVTGDRIKWLRVHSSPRCGPDGRTTGGFGTVQDITERKRAEQAVEDVARFPNENPHPVLRVSAGGEVLFANRASEPLKGLFYTETGKSVAEPWLGLLRKAFTNATREIVEIDCEGRVYSLDLVPIVDQGYVNVYGRDVTLRKQVEHDLERAQQVGSIGSWRLDVRRNHLVWSEQNHRIFGIPAGTPMNYETFLSRVHPDDLGFVHQRWDAALEGEPYDIEHRIVVDGATEWVHEKAFIERDEKGEVIGGFGITQDVTARRELQERLERHADELAEANRELDAFAHSVSHDLRNPVNNLLAMTEILEENYEANLDEDGIRCVHEIQRGGRRMEAIIADLLRLSRITRREPRREEVDLSTAAGKVMEDIGARKPRPDVRVNIEGNMRAQADPGLLRHVLHNLLGNAWKYTTYTENATIEMGTREQDGGTVYFVRDNGEGFDPRHASHLFEPFTRLHKRDKYEGTGIGLSLVKRIVARHGGKIWAEGEPGKGSTFYFTLG